LFARRAGYGGDIRQPYNFYANDLIAAMVEPLSVNIKCAIVLWYYGCRAQLVSDFSVLFPKGEGKGGSDTGTWTDIIHGLAGGKFGDIDQTGRAMLRVVLTELKLRREQQ
jgi:hypothetical protein